MTMKNNGTAISVKWIPNPLSEAVMRRNALRFKIITVKLDEIDFNYSLTNQARFVPLTETVRDRYANAMINGFDFFMCVVAPVPEKEKSTKKYMFIDGNHRGGAAKAVGETEMKVYLVDTSSGQHDEIYVSLPRVINEPNGHDLTPEESVAHALHDITAGLRTIEDAAQNYSLKVDTLRLHQRAQEVKVALENDGIRVPADVRNTTRLAPLTRVPLESVMKAAGRVVIEGGLNKTEVEDLVRDLKGASKNEAAQLAIINDLEQSLSLGLKQKRKSKTERTSHAVRLRLMSWITKGERIWKGKTRLAQFDVNDVDAVTRRLRQLEKHIHAVTCP